jgi:hypothetical protein
MARSAKDGDVHGQPEKSSENEIFRAARRRLLLVWQPSRLPLSPTRIQRPA